MSNYTLSLLILLSLTFASVSNANNSCEVKISEDKKVRGKNCYPYDDDEQYIVIEPCLVNYKCKVDKDKFEVEFKPGVCSSPPATPANYGDKPDATNEKDIEDCLI